MSLNNRTLLKWFKAMKKDVRGKMEFKYYEFLEWMSTIDLINALEIDDTKVNGMELEKLKIPADLKQLVAPAAVKLQLGLNYADLKDEEKYRFTVRTIEEDLMKSEHDTYTRIGEAVKTVNPIAKDSVKFNEISEAIAHAHGWKEFKSISDLRQEVTLTEDMYARIGYGDTFINMDGNLPLYLKFRPYAERKLTLTAEEVEYEFYEAIRLKRIKVKSK